jgi:hypothetical protein
MIEFKIKPDLWVEITSDEAEFEKALKPRWKTNDKEEKCPLHINKICLVLTVCDRPCHSAIGRVSHERACLAQLDKMNSTNP